MSGDSQQLRSSTSSASASFSSSYSDVFLSRSATKRDSFAAELERDPQLSASKRQQRTQAFTSNMAHASLERQLVAAQSSKMELETKVREKEHTIERLERDRRWFADREKEEKEEKERERAEHEEEKRKADAELRTLRNALSTLREQYGDLEDAHSVLSRTSSRDLASQKSKITTLTHQVSLLSQELDECNRIAEERRQAMREVQERLDAIDAREGTDTVRDSDGDMVVVREELHRQAGYLRNTESTNARLDAELRILRERQESVEVLKEEKRWLEGRLRKFDEMRERVVSLEAEVEAARKEREDWAKNTTNVITPSNTPISVTQTLSALRLSHARLLEEHGANVALLRRREMDLGKAERQIADMTEAISTFEAQVREIKEQIARREQRVVLAEREIGFLQALVASFTAEEASERDRSKALGGEIEEAKSRRLQELESLLGEFKAKNDALMKELDALGGASARLQGRSWDDLFDDFDHEHAFKVELQQALEDAKAESLTQSEKIEELEQKLFDLCGDIAAGQHVPPGVRVLSLKDNPEQAWVDLRQSAMDRLRGENEALLKRLKELEALAASAGASGTPSAADGKELVPRESWELVVKEKNELEEMVVQKEKRLERLQMIFASKGEEFREAIASILGLKLAFYPNGQVRVTSVFDLNAAFIFQQPLPGTEHGSTGKVQLVATGNALSQELPQLMRSWIEEEQCIPGFLASVTMECYDKAKREGTLPQAVM